MKTREINFLYLLLIIWFVIHNASCVSRPFSFPEKGVYTIVNKNTQVNAEFIVITTHNHDWLGADSRIFIRISYPNGGSIVLDKDFSFGGGEYEWFVDEFYWFNNYKIVLKINSGINGPQEFIIDTNTFSIEEVNDSEKKII